MPELTTLDKCIWLEKQELPSPDSEYVWNIAEALMLDGVTYKRNVEYIDKLYAKLKGLETTK